ncbi:GNAT family N-acetyltransferase [Diaphorobacter ruginosibacter]|uniref:GNAT family N-acetyltransferase n=1 Tax=Diaphorobacter ruginosibacter TaxID=1715720 RepID=A0A7G9RJ70_9BURK|nr:GNAT family N-acetyltransferase [Diaphorobacter ruginosibacter]QNN55645.1 GNAT family N-acetyltransferase [Diaphorobacter ruginosibacter]
MNLNYHIRRFEPGDEPLLRQVFFSAVHGSAARNYTVEQRMAWAPEDYDASEWSRRMEKNQPFVLTMDGVPVAFADLQQDGYIDQFFVDARQGGKGLGLALLRFLLARAEAEGLPAIHSHVSLTAEPLFTKAGFFVEERRVVELRGVLFSNALMCRLLVR